jgi:hypothetical protein
VAAKSQVNGPESSSGTEHALADQIGVTPTHRDLAKPVVNR